MSKLRYYREKVDPGQARPFGGTAMDFVVGTSDGVAIAGTRLAADCATPVAAQVLVHGLFAHRRVPSLLELAESLTRFGPVWTIDLRGHGTSGGTCTLGEAEILDVAAVTALVRQETVLPVVTIGLSLGAATVVRAAALLDRPDAVVAISGPAEWRGRRGFGAWKTSLTWRLPGAPQAMQRLTGFRLAGTEPGGPSPVAVVDAIAPTPVLVVHGTRDPFFPPGEAMDLHRRAGFPKDLWIIDGGGHAESLFCVPGRPVVRQTVDTFADGLHGRLAALMTSRR